MNYKNLFKSSGVSRVGLIGTGVFGRTFLAQSRFTPNISVPAVCDRDIVVAENACRQVGIKTEDLKVCHTESEAYDTISSGKTAVVSDARLLLDLPVEVVVEATGAPDIGAALALSAIDHGKHVVMATKESDCVVGSILYRLAEKAGVVYTPAHGDQPSLLIELISWAETLGFEIVCAGKAGELDFVYDSDLRTIARGKQTASFAQEDFCQPAGGAAEQVINLRRRALESLTQFSVADLCEMAIVINSTDYGYDTPQLHAPIARIIELPEIMCSRSDGGILHKEGIIDMVNCLRRSDEISFGGGVFIIVKCREHETWQFLKAKGHLVSHDGARAMIFRPYHLLGVETATSVLTANRLKQSTGGIDPKPRVDVGIRANRRLPQGYRLTLEHDHSIAGVIPEILPAGKMTAESPVPYYMAADNCLKHTVEKGRLLTCRMIEHDPHSCLWQLRREQDELFFGDDKS